MKEARLSPCRTCGKEISTNLARRAKTDTLATVSVGCPHCGEANPHITEEEIEKIREQQKINEANTESYRVLQQYELEKQARKDRFWKWVLYYPFVGLSIIFVILVPVFLFMIGGGC